jgi:hypothetical protein
VTTNEDGWEAVLRHGYEESFSEVGVVTFPPPQDININMMPFVMGDITSIPVEYRHYWPLIAACPLPCKTQKVRTSSYPNRFETVKPEIGKVGYLTIQEGFVPAGSSQRRPGLHVGWLGEEYLYPI